MKKKIFTTIALFLSLALTACGSNEKSTEVAWESNGTYHWHLDENGERIDNARHELAVDETKSVAATCKAEGKKVEICSVCGYVKETTLAQLAHQWDEGRVTKEATCSVPGEKTFTCALCGDTKIEEITVPHDLQAFAYTPAEGEVNVAISKCSRDEYYEIKFNAFDANAEVNVSGDKHSNYVKLSKQVDIEGAGTASYIEFKIHSPKAMKGRFWVDITGNTSNMWSRSSKSGAQSVFYTYDDQTTFINTWKNKVELNGSEVDFENATYKIGDEDVKFAELEYDDFGTLSSSTSSGTPISVPFPEVNLVEGLNTLRITRLTGYAFNMHTFTFKANIN